MAGCVLLRGEPGAQQDGLVKHSGIDDHCKLKSHPAGTHTGKSHLSEMRLHADQRSHVVPPGNTASTPLIGPDCQSVVAFICETEDLFAAVAIFGRDDPTHLVSSSEATISHILKRDAGRHVIWTRQVAGLLGTVIEDLLGLLVARYDSLTKKKRLELQIVIDKVERRRVDLVDIDLDDLVWFFENGPLLKNDSISPGVGASILRMMGRRRSKVAHTGWFLRSDSLAILECFSADFVVSRRLKICCRSLKRYSANSPFWFAYGGKSQQFGIFSSWHD